MYRDFEDSNRPVRSVSPISSSKLNDPQKLEKAFLEGELSIGEVLDKASYKRGMEVWEVVHGSRLIHKMLRKLRREDTSESVLWREYYRKKLSDFQFTHNFFFGDSNLKLSMDVYGCPDRKMILEAESYIENYDSENLSEKREKQLMNGAEIRRAFYEFGQEFFVESGYEIRPSKYTSMSFSHSSRRVLVPRKRKRSRAKVQGLFFHEVCGHAFRKYNGDLTGFDPLMNGVNGYYTDEEGVAVYTEMRGMGMSHEEIKENLWTLKRAANVVVTARMLKEPEISAQKIYDTYESIFGLDTSKSKVVILKESYRYAIRVLSYNRFNKECAYSIGLRRVVDFMETASAEDISLLWGGKFPLSMLEEVRDFYNENEIELPKYDFEYAMSLRDDINFGNND